MIPMGIIPPDRVREPTQLGEKPVGQRAVAGTDDEVVVHSGVLNRATAKQESGQEITASLVDQWVLAVALVPVLRDADELALAGWTDSFGPSEAERHQV